MGDKIADEVCIVSPVYNGETYLGRFLESLILQTYRPLRLVLVNDGSTDNTSQVIDSYKNRLSAAEISFHRIDQPNLGQANAISNGLKMANGDYLIWPDTDDFLFPESIEKRVSFLKSNPSYGFVITDGLEFDESDLNNPCRIIEPKLPESGNVSKFALSGFIFQSPAVMARMSSFLFANPERKIFNTRNGQNVQLLLPLAISSRCGAIREPLYGRVLRKASHSKLFSSNPEAVNARTNALFETVIQTLLLIENSKPWHFVYASAAYYEAYWKNERINDRVSLKQIGNSTKLALLKTFKATVKVLARCVLNKLKASANFNNKS